MPKTVNLTTAQALFSIPLPNHGGTYTVVSHKFIVDEVLAQLQANNLKVVDEVYKTNLNGEIAQGTYVLEYGDDPDLSLMFAWVNSYDKTMRFKCGVGVSINMIGEGFMMSGDMSNYGRKHIHNAQQEVKDHIADQLQKAAQYYKDLSDHKRAMTGMHINATEAGSLLGRLFYTHEAITSSQLIIIKDKTRKLLNSGTIKLWTLYAIICESLRTSHPKTWMEQQKDLHAEVTTTYLVPFYEALEIANASQPEQLPGQTNLLDQIEEIENSTIAFNAPDIIEEKPVNVEDDWSEQDLKDFEAASLSDFIDDEASSILSLDGYLSETTKVNEEDSISMEQQGDKDAELAEGDNEFPAAPADIPIFIPESEKEVKSELEQILEEEKSKPENQAEVFLGNDFTPLHEQVASEEVLPVTQEEMQISTAPIVNVEDEIVFQEPSYASDFDFNSETGEVKTGSSEMPDFEF